VAQSQIQLFSPSKADKRSLRHCLFGAAINVSIDVTAGSKKIIIAHITE